MVSEPLLHSSAAIDPAQLLGVTDATHATPPANAGDGAAYFPSQYPAPTNIEEQAPTF